MWQLKFIQEHKDCMYSGILKKLKLTMYGYPLNNFQSKGILFVNNIQIISGEEKNIKKYLNYLKNKKEVEKFEIIAPNAFSFQIKLPANKEYYQNIYSQQIFYPVPIIHKEGKEILTIASWNREILEKIMKNVENNKNTTFLKILHLKQNPLKKFYIPQILPDLTENQFEIIKLAKERGYWNYPKKITITKLAKELKKAKSTIHETLRRAEVRLMNYYA